MFVIEVNREDASNADNHQYLYHIFYMICSETATYLNQLDLSVRRKYILFKTNYLTITSINLLDARKSCLLCLDLNRHSHYHFQFGRDTTVF